MDRKTLKLVYVTPALYMAGGVERVLTLKANYFAEHDGYDVTIVLTEGKGKPLFYPLSDKVKVINLGLDFEELWTCSFLRKIPLYLKKQRRFRRLLTQTLLQLRPDITVSMLRREINFINEIKEIVGPSVLLLFHHASVCPAIHNNSTLFVDDLFPSE